MSASAGGSAARADAQAPGRRRGGSRAAVLDRTLKTRNRKSLMPPPRQSRSCVIVVENLPVPFDRRVWQEAQALARAGWLVSVISPATRQRHDTSPCSLPGTLSPTTRRRRLSPSLKRHSGTPMAISRKSRALLSARTNPGRRSAARRTKLDRRRPTPHFCRN